MQCEREAAVLAWVDAKRALHVIADVSEATTSLSRSALSRGRPIQQHLQAEHLCRDTHAQPPAVHAKLALRRLFGVC